MIHNLEVERRRIDEALEVLRRLHRMRKPSAESKLNSVESGDTSEDSDAVDYTLRREPD